MTRIPMPCCLVFCRSSYRQYMSILGQKIRKSTLNSIEQFWIPEKDVHEKALSKIATEEWKFSTWKKKSTKLLELFWPFWPVNEIPSDTLTFWHLVTSLSHFLKNFSTWIIVDCGTFFAFLEALWAQETARKIPEYYVDWEGVSICGIASVG